MYTPSAFRVERKDLLHRLITDYPFAPLVTTMDGGHVATHLPFLLDPTAGRFGVLRAHMARPNPQWNGFAAGQDALVIFQGPHAYVSPSWYTTQPAVPTWNYAVVHAYGVPRVVDEARLRRILLDTVNTFESNPESDSIPDAYFDKMVGGVVGFEIEITRLEGKYKLGQNRSVEDRRGVVSALRDTGRAGDREMSDWMSAMDRECGTHQPSS